MKICIFGSGNGTNAQRISEYFALHPSIQVDSIVYNKKDAYIAERAHKLGIDAQYFGWNDFYHSDKVLEFLRQRNIDAIILAGFLWLVPDNLLRNYPNRIVNIHPALLPKYGGKGMYGEHVHEAVIAHHETESGITIHLVNEHYDEGQHLFQAHCSVTADDTPETLAAKIHQLEQTHFPVVIEKWLNG